MRVLFWGTPDFALPPLRALIGEGFDVVGVVTQPDRAVGRSRSTLEPPPVKRVAAAEAIPVLQPERPRGDEFLAQLRELTPDISVVVAYGHILSQATSSTCRRAARSTSTRRCCRSFAARRPSRRRSATATPRPASRSCAW